MKNFIKAIDAARQAQDMSITELASKAGVSRQHLYQIMSERHCPRLNIADAMARAVGVEVKIGQKRRLKK